jgi:glyoxylase-like metal-dependent hydrolase (beta-lactamase superfamily II)
VFLDRFRERAVYSSVGIVSRDRSPERRQHSAFRRRAGLSRLALVLITTGAIFGSFSTRLSPGVVNSPVTRQADPPAVIQLPAFPVDYSLKHDRDFRPSGSLKKLSEHLYVLDDTCNVYILKSGERALLVGFGSGEILKRLPEIGVRQVDEVVFTHHHRDQAQGLCDLGAPAFRVDVSEQEARFFEDVEAFWRVVHIFLNYDCRSHWNTIRKSVLVTRRLKPGDRVNWQGFELEAIETPGATDHSLSYLATIDGRKVVFCGNLISGAGKVPNWFDLHWDYYGFTQGIDASLESFARLRAKNPDRLLPAHGDTIDKPAEAMEANAKKYAVLREMLIPNELVRVQQEERQILPHLIFVGANCYAILSASGKAFIWDYGYVDRDRIDELKKRFGTKKIDVLSFSHYHDDHVIRAWELYREGTVNWVYENMADLFAHPSRYRLPCLIPFAIPADRVVHDGEKIRWEEYELEFFHLPGQTEFHQGLLTTIDGKRVLFTGDDTWNRKFPEKVRNGPLVPQNEYLLDSGFIACARKMIECRPDLVCPAHTEEYAPTAQDLKEFLGWALRLREVMTSLIDQPDPNFGMDYRWCCFYPYRAEVAPGGTVRLELRLRNHLFKSANVEIKLKLPEGFSCPFPERQITMAGKTHVAVPFDIVRAAANAAGSNGRGSDLPAADRQSGTARDAAHTNRQVITADITINGHRIGEYAEALID